MKIKEINYPTSLEKIENIYNDNVDVFVELEDGITYTVIVSTPKNYYWYMEKENKDFISAMPPDIIVKELTDECIRKAIETYCEGDAYWLKLYHLIGYDKGLFSIGNLNKMIKDLNID